MFVKLTDMSEIGYSIYLNFMHIVSIVPNTEEPGTIIVTVNDGKYFVKETAANLIKKMPITKID